MLGHLALVAVTEVDDLDGWARLSQVFVESVYLLLLKVTRMILKMKHYVMWLQIAMQDILFRKIQERLHDLLDQEVHLALPQKRPVLDQLIEVGAVAVVHYDVVGTSSRLDVADAYDIGVM